MARLTDRSNGRLSGLHASRIGLTRSHWEAINTNLWVVPTAMVVFITALFALTSDLDREVAVGRLALPVWISSGSADGVRQILIAIATAVITVAGVVFSITILVLQLASQQFGPRMLRNFIRDRGTQVSLGAFVATFFYAVLVLVSVTDPPREFVPHLSTSTAVALTLVDLIVLIYYIDHVASSIQLTSIVSDIAVDFRTTLGHVRADAQRWQAEAREVESTVDSELPDFAGRIAAEASGFLQAIGHARLVAIASESDAIIRLIHRPGHFVVAGQLLAVVAPGSAVESVASALTAAHIVGPNRTLTQDPSFAIDQLVEVAIRALSPAINDTFTALNCIDWLGECLCRACVDPLPSGIWRDATGRIRLIEPSMSLERLIKGATDKIRQAGRGIPAIMIRQLENLQKVMGVSRTPDQREAILHHAQMILRSSEESVPEEFDRRDVRAAYDALVAVSREAWQG
jgi:uncharacterized membrane protein